MNNNNNNEKKYGIDDLKYVVMMLCTGETEEEYDKRVSEITDEQREAARKIMMLFNRDWKSRLKVEKNKK